jgi:uracil-DNA glycosylase
VGGTAHRFAFGPRVKLDEIVGRDVRWKAAPSASVICLPHPSGASTWLNAEPHVELWRRAIALLAERWSEIAADPAGAP